MDRPTEKMPWTPGPWSPRFDKRRLDPWTIEGPKAWIASVHPCALDKKTDPQAEANARLIAAAPDLYEAGAKVLAGLLARIDAADRSAVPVFDGIADLHDALNKARLSSTDTGG